MNIFSISTFFFLRWGANIFDRTHIVEKNIVFVFVLLLLIVGFFSKVVKFRRVVLLFNFNLLFFIILIAGFEWIFWAFPSLLPKALTDFAPQLNSAVATKRLELLDYLDENPWVKFKANIEVDTAPITYRGDDFNYTWQTDNLGFKNNADLSRIPKITALAVGDSSVEAMGVVTEKTWESIVSNSGYGVYNMGVQGYSPQQITGSLEKFGSQFNADYVIYGYTVGFEQRTLYFANMQSGSVFTGAVEAVNKFTEERRAIVGRPFAVVNATIDFWENLLSSNVLFNSGKKSDKDFLNFYIDEINRVDDQFDDKGLAWQLTKESILDAKRIADGKNMKFVILLFPNRDFVYSEKLTGRALVNSDAQLIASLKKFSSEKSIDVIDIYPALKLYVDSLPEPIDVSKLPYFKLDGHLNQIGQEIVANLVVNYFNTRP